MVPTCAHLYPSGKTCGRIPRRGEHLCRDHRRAAPAGPIEPALDSNGFNAEMFRECDRLALLPLDKVLDAAQDHCVALESFMERHAGPRLHAHYTKLGIALTDALDRLLAQRQVLAEVIPNLHPAQLELILGALWNAQPQPVEVLPD